MTYVFRGRTENSLYFNHNWFFPKIKLAWSNIPFLLIAFYSRLLVSHYLFTITEFVLLLSLFPYLKHATFFMPLLHLGLLLSLRSQVNAVNWWQRFNAHSFVNTVYKLLILSYFLHELADSSLIKINLTFISRLSHVST